MLITGTPLPYVRDLQGNVVTKDDLPPAGMKEWGRNEKFIVGKAVLAGVVPFDETLAQYGMVAAELNSWMRDAEQGRPRNLHDGVPILPDKEAREHIDDLKWKPQTFNVRGLSLAVDFDAETFSFSGVRSRLPGARWRCLKILALNGGVVVSKEALARLSPRKIELKTVDVVICNLRDKLEKACPGAGGQTFIETIWGRGYLFPKPI